MSEASINTAAAVSDESASRRPAFRLQQLLVLMAVMAVMLAVSGRSELQGIDDTPLVQLAFMTSRVVFTLLGSIAITIVSYRIWWRKRGQQFFSQPGHWLLTNIAVHQLLLLCELLFLEAIAGIKGVDRGTIGTQLPFGATLLVPGVLLVILNVYIGREKCSDARWRRVFYANAFAEVIPVLGHMLVLIYLERAVRSERIPRPLSSQWVRARGVQPMTDGQVVTTPRDFAHWCGVAITFAEGGMMVLFAIVIIYYLVILASS